MLEKAKEAEDLTEAEKARIRQDQEAKNAQLLAAVMKQHPLLTNEKAIRYLKEAGAV